MGVAVMTSRFGTAAASLALQSETLMHPETMLLVDHHQAEIAELNELLEQRQYVPMRMSIQRPASSSVRMTPRSRPRSRP